MTLDELKDNLRRRMIEYEGNIAPHHLVDIIADAKTLGLEEKDIGRLVPELDQSINWAALKEEQRLALEAKHLKKQEELQAAELVDALINYCFSNGIVVQSALATIFSRAAELRQNEVKVAKRINKQLEKGGYKPYPNPDLKASGLKQILLSTSWYDDKNYTAVVSKAKLTNTQPLAVISSPVIHFFNASKTTIKKKESIVISWHVSGVDHITISGLGNTKLLRGNYTVSPSVDTIYVLEAGGIRQPLNITITKSSNKAWGLLAIAGLLFFFYLAGQTGNEITGTPSPATENEVYINPYNGIQLGKSSKLTVDEKEKITATLYSFYREDNGDGQAANIQRLVNLFANPIDQYYKVSNITQAELAKRIGYYLNKKLAAHSSIIEDYAFIERTASNGYLIGVKGWYNYTLRKARKSKSVPIKDFIRLNNSYQITAIYNEP